MEKWQRNLFASLRKIMIVGRGAVNIPNKRDQGGVSLIIRLAANILPAH